MTHSMGELPPSSQPLPPVFEDPQLLLNRTLLPELRKLRFKCRNSLDTGAISVTHPDYHNGKFRGNWFNGLRSNFALIEKMGFLKESSIDPQLHREVSEYVSYLGEHPVKDVLRIEDLPADIEARIIRADALIDRVLACLSPRMEQRKIAVHFEEKVRACESYRIPPDVRLKVSSMGYPSLKILALGINKKCEHAVLAVLGACEHKEAGDQHADELLSEVIALRKKFDEQYTRIIKNV